MSLSYSIVTHSKLLKPSMSGTCNSCNLGMRALPDMYARGQRAYISRARGVTKGQRGY